MLLGCLHASTTTQGRHLLCCIKGTIDYKLTTDLILTMLPLPPFSDVESVKSTIGFVLLMGGGAVSWSSMLQSRVARSTTEAEFIAGESYTRDMALFQYILENLGYKVTLP